MVAKEVRHKKTLLKQQNQGSPNEIRELRWLKDLVTVRSTISKVNSVNHALGERVLSSVCLRANDKPGWELLVLAVGDLLGNNNERILR